MTIIIKDEEPLILTQKEYEVLLGEYNKAMEYRGDLIPSFESWARQKKSSTTKKLLQENENG